MEYYNLLSPDDGPELEECEICGLSLPPDDLEDGICDDCYEEWDGFDDEEDEDEE